MDDAEQLSALAHPPLSPYQTNIQIELESEQNAEGGDSNDSYDHALPPSLTSAQTPSQRIPLNTDPSHVSSSSSAVTISHSGSCWRRFISGVLNFPSLAIVFPTVFVLSIVYTMLNLVSAPDAFKYLNTDPSMNQPSLVPSTAAFVITLMFCIVIVTLVLLATRQLLYQLFGGQIKVGQIIGLYLATIMLYGNLYQLCLLVDVTSFSFATGAASTTNVFSVFVAMQYYAVTTITCTGFGDVRNKHTQARICRPNGWYDCISKLLILTHIPFFSSHFRLFPVTVFRK